MFAALLWPRWIYIRQNHRDVARACKRAYATDLSVYRQSLEALLDMMQKGVSAEIGREYALADAAQAQSDLEAGRTTGSLLLMP
ncbi:zinc-binding dehydrogenase [Sphingobium lactosutens]|uniref:Alcohol dehydrogenase-like C-terminal domain-containing protein n=1 Tax=Sphingobium lactosutens DS20 TaxID=1331060 RepID=T0IT21_9SPHN|nr:zinc-binding dehydrogenase [Sphingobium lactosutens]EQB14990.1 hypothetical protein RLDS_12530 [Sphingobium lactosutens DS20]